ncbi:hypothetical protein KW842_15640 [Duganella sp. sic0402]|uniref:glycosyltransferase family 9 protein n=1 Tax=Duganella sp. sic0402 TaxID=2854786 RepID=UPI001C49586A|nr:hypothetical protein [Duganella sp. sic0402]MBV7537200.1 hypothetical protein [Duganella sp. sic0402]
MHIFSLSKDVTLDTKAFRRHFQAVTDPDAAQVDRLYLEVGCELRLIIEKLQDEYVLAHPGTDEAAKQMLSLDVLGVKLGGEESLLAWPFFPTRLGRMSSRLVGEGLYFHKEAEVLPAQLQALRASKPDKQHFRIAVINGFGANLGDCTMGITAFRQVQSCLARYLPGVSCDIVFGGGVAAAAADIVAFDKSVERVLLQTPTVCEFAQYDGYFDFSSITDMPEYETLPAVDWYLWWCGLDPQAVRPEEKRNRGHIRRNAWNEVHSVLRDEPGKKVLFNPKASAQLRTMPPEIASKFAKRLLELDPEMKLIVDQPIDLVHKRLIDLSGQINTPEKFKALCGLVDGLITVNSFASHVADLCSTPAVHLCSTIAGSHYPYYPFSAAINPQGYEQLPAFGKVKVEDDVWEKISSLYHNVWESISPAEVLSRLQEKMVQRQAAAHEPKRLSLVGDINTASCVDSNDATRRLVRQRLIAEHVHATERLAHLIQQILKPGSVCVLACAPDASLAVTLAKRVAPHGELIVMEPRALLARSVESSLFNAGLFASRVMQTMAVGGAKKVTMRALDPWTESRSSEWGNTHQVVTVPNQTVDDLALTSCGSLVVQSPMPFGQFIAGAMQTLKRCRPFIFMGPVSRDEAANAFTVGLEAGYEFWAEAALPGNDLSSMLVVGCPKEKGVKMDRFLKVNVT